VSVFYGFGEADDAAVPTGNTPAPESGAAGEEAGEALAGEGVAPAGAGEVCGAPCVFMSSRRKALLEKKPVKRWQAKVLLPRAQAKSAGRLASS